MKYLEIIQTLPITTFIIGYHKSISYFTIKVEDKHDQKLKRIIKVYNITTVIFYVLIAAILILAMVDNILD